MDLYRRLICLETGFLGNSEEVILENSNNEIFFNEIESPHISNLNSKDLKEHGYELIKKYVNAQKRYELVCKSEKLLPLIEKWDSEKPIIDSFDELKFKDSSFNILDFNKLFPVKQTKKSMIYHIVLTSDYCPNFILDSPDNFAKINYLDRVINHLRSEFNT